MPLRPALSSPLLQAIAGDRPAQGAGEFIPDRSEWLTGVIAPAGSGNIMLTFWTADKSEPINNIRVKTGATAAAATPTLCRMGIYTVNAAGDLTALVASTVNDTALFSAANTDYTKALSSTFDKVAGQRYAAALIVVTATTLPVFVGGTAAGATATVYGYMFELPAKCSRVSGQTDLGASYTRAQQAVWPSRIGFTLT